MDDIMHNFTILFLMLGPFKIIAPYTNISKNADPILARQIAVRAILYSSIILLLAGLIGESILTKYGIPVPILAMAGGIILFLVALLNIIQQFAPVESHPADAQPATLKMAMYPLAFPTIVTPYGIAAVIVFLALSPDLNARLLVGAVVVGIMVMNLVIMLLNRYIYKFFAVILPLLGAILGVVQVSLGLLIIYKSIVELLKL